LQPLPPYLPASVAPLGLASSFWDLHVSVRGRAMRNRSSRSNGHRHAVACPPKQSFCQFLLVSSAVAEGVRQPACRGQASAAPAFTTDADRRAQGIPPLIRPLPLWQPVLAIRRFSWRRCESIEGLSRSCGELEGGGWLRANSNEIRRQMCAWAKEIYRGKVFEWLRKPKQSKKLKN
jgi:hypothetical protein